MSQCQRYLLQYANEIEATDRTRKAKYAGQKEDTTGVYWPVPVSADWNKKS